MDSSAQHATHLADLVAAAAARHPDHPALVDAAAGTALTWAEFDAAVSAEARRLAGHGVGAGDRVALRPAGGPELAVAVLGALRAGAVAVPLAGGADDTAALADCDPRVLVGEGSTTTPGGWVVVGPPDPAARAEPVAAVGGGEDLALLLYTPRPPRGVCLSHRAVLANRAQAAALRPSPVTPVDRVLLAQPLFHAYGLAAGLFQVCWAGATAVLPGPGRPDPEKLLDAVVRHRVSALAAVPSTYRALLELPAERLRAALGGLRLCTSGVVPLPPAWATAFHEATGLRVVEGYGLTEAGPVVTSTPLDGAAGGGVGRPLPGVEMRLVDREGRPLAPRLPDVPAGDVPAGDGPDGTDGTADGSADGSAADGEPAGAADVLVPDDPEPAAGSEGGSEAGSDAGSDAPAARPGVADVRAAASRAAVEVRAAAERGVAEVRAAAERAATEVRAAVRAAAPAGDPVGDMIDDAQDVEGPADPETGLVAVRGPNLFSGYWPDRSGGPDADGWFRTADLGFVDAAGDLHLVDRSSDLVVVNGFTVYPREVEQVVAELPAVVEAAVVGVPDGRTGQAVRAVVVRTGTLDADGVRAHCRARLARFKVPAQVVFVDALPRTPAGRVARDRLGTAAHAGNGEGTA